MTVKPKYGACRAITTPNSKTDQKLEVFCNKNTSVDDMSEKLLMNFTYDIITLFSDSSIAFHVPRAAAEEKAVFAERSSQICRSFDIVRNAFFT